MFINIIVLILCIIMTMIIYDIQRVVESNSLIIQELYIMRGELNILLDVAEIVIKPERNQPNKTKIEII